MSNFFTADTHFNHLRANELCRRPFKTVEEMNDVILNNINKRVTKSDTLWIIGDFCMGGEAQKSALDFRMKINAGIVNLIHGNHDYKGHRKYKEIKYYPETFDAVHVVWMGEIERQFMYLSHWAGRTWPEQGRRSWNLYGHSHASLPDDPNALAIDSGIDTEWPGIHERFYPYSMDELHKIMSKKVFVQIDHHGDSN